MTHNQHIYKHNVKVVDILTPHTYSILEFGGASLQQLNGSDP